MEWEHGLLGDVVAGGQHLEHAHSYTSSGRGAPHVAGPGESTLPMHVDQGILVAMAAGTPPEGGAAELRLRLATGDEQGHKRVLQCHFNSSL